MNTILIKLFFHLYEIYNCLGLHRFINDYNTSLENKVWFSVSYFVDTYYVFIKTVVKIAKKNP